MDSDGGYPHRIFLQPLSKNLECNICLMIVKDGLRCNNDHNFCKTCLTKHLSTDQNCPSCRIVLTMETATISRTVNLLIEELQVKCFTVPETNVQNPMKRTRSGCKNDCEWSGKTAMLDTHLASCLFLVTKCSYAGCNVKMERKSIHEHENECMYKPDKCLLCDDVIPKYLLLLHGEEFCREKEVLCVNGCNTMVKRYMMDNHKKTCPMENIDCPLKNIGCSFSCLRKDMNDHCRKKKDHFQPMIQTIQLLQNKTEELKNEIKELKRFKYFWEIPNFLFLPLPHFLPRPGSADSYTSPSFIVFGYTMCIVVIRHTDTYDFGLKMESRRQVSLYSTFHMGSYSKTRLSSFSATSCIDKREERKEVIDKELSADGTLLMEVTIWKPSV